MNGTLLDVLVLRTNTAFLFGLVFVVAEVVVIEVVVVSSIVSENVLGQNLTQTPDLAKFG